jgi:hypothetical protein
VAYADYIGYWRQFVTPQTRARRREQVQSFFRAQDAETALTVARQLQARYVYLSGPRRRKRALERAGVIELLFHEGGEKVYRIDFSAPLSDPLREGEPDDGTAAARVPGRTEP